MVVWTKRVSMILAASAFFATLFLSLDFSRLFDTSVMVSALVKSVVAASLFWFAGFIVADVIFKGMVEDVPNDPVNMVEGGILQHIYNHQVKTNPLLMDEFASAETKEDDPSGKKKKNKKEKR